MERCCRNILIFSIVSPGSAAPTFYLEFPAVVRNGQVFRDSTPQVFPPVSDYACVGEVFSYDFGGRDPARPCASGPEPSQAAASRRWRPK